MATDPRTALHLATRVGPGQKIEIETPQLAEDEAVEVFVVASIPAEPRRRTILEFLDATAMASRSAAGWEQFDAEFQRERDAWDR